MWKEKGDFTKSNLYYITWLNVEGSISQNQTTIMPTSQYTFEQFLKASVWVSIVTEAELAPNQKLPRLQVEESTSGWKLWKWKITWSKNGDKWSNRFLFAMNPLYTTQIVCNELSNCCTNCPWKMWSSVILFFFWIKNSTIYKMILFTKNYVIVWFFDLNHYCWRDKVLTNFNHIKIAIMCIWERG